MSVFASFNGGPTERAVLLAILASGIGGVIVGGLVKRMGIGFVAGLLSGVLICGVILMGGNEPGDAAGLFLVGALILFCPLGGLLGGLGAATAGWIVGKLGKAGHEPTQKGAIAFRDAGAISAEAEPDPTADPPRE